MFIVFLFGLINVRYKLRIQVLGRKNTFFVRGISCFFPKKYRYMQKVVVVWLSTNMSCLYENGGLFYNHLCMQNKSRFFRWKDSFEGIRPSWRTADWPFSSRIACVGWLKTVAWDDVHWQKLCYCDYKVHYWAVVRWFYDQFI